MMRLSPACPAVVLGAVLAVAGCAPVPVQRPAAASVTLDGHRFQVEVATTPAEQARGLMNRASMPPDHGMLFVFPGARPRTFWMKNTLIPLDMLFFDANRRLVAIQRDAQPCTADPCRLYPSDVPARYVLELNAGTAARIGARTGDVITFSGVSDSGIQ